MSTAPLNDIKNIVDSRPDLSLDEWEIVKKATPYLKTLLVPEIRTELEVEYAKARVEFETMFTEQNAKMIRERFDEIKKDLEPLGPEDMNKLLSQNYVKFKTVVEIPTGNSTVDEDGFEIPEVEVKKFVIRELPQACEERFLEIMRESLVPLLQDQAAAKFKLDGTLVQKIQSLIDTIPGALKMSAELVSIILDPWKKHNIDGDWVATNMSTYRIAAAIIAQSEANRYRDFFFLGSRTFRKT